MALKQAWAAVVIQRHCRGYLVRRVYQLVLRAAVIIQAYTRGWTARKRYRKAETQSLSFSVKCFMKVTHLIVSVCVLFQMVAAHKAVVLQKYARAWLARRRFQTMRRLVINVQLSYRVQQLRKKIEEQVRSDNREGRVPLSCTLSQTFLSKTPKTLIASNHVNAVKLKLFIAHKLHIAHLF